MGEKVINVLELVDAPDDLSERQIDLLHAVTFTYSVHEDRDGAVTAIPDDIEADLSHAIQSPSAELIDEIEGVFETMDEGDLLYERRAELESLYLT